MGSVTFVVGFAGSGKSWVIDNEIKPDLAVHENFAAEGEYEANHARLVAALRRGERCAVSELQSLSPAWRAMYGARLRAEVPDARVEWIYFAKDLETANHNCRRSRADKPNDPTGEDHVRLNNDWAPHYVIPPRSPVRAIYRLP